MTELRPLRAESEAERDMDDARPTIFALASGAGRAGVAVVRVSGPQADWALARLTRKTLPAERHAEIRTLFSFAMGDRIDRALVFRFVAPRSYTGENLVEFQIHGGRAVIGALLTALADLPGMRPAEPGEFTRRAVENGRMDLTQAEAIADLVNAETDAQRLQALRQLDGALGALYEGWRARLVQAGAWFEGAIDFAEDEVPESALAASRAELTMLGHDIRAHLEDGRRGEILREGFQVAIIGPPNVGKSALLNALARRDVAIVSEMAGTTRDVLEVRLDLGGFPVILADTAGIRDSADSVEIEGVRRARARAQAADVRVVVRDGSRPAAGAPAAPGVEDLQVWNKADLARSRERPGLWVSAKTGEGIPALLDLLTARAERALGDAEAPALTRTRHRTALEGTVESLARAADPSAPPELAAEEARLALAALGRITGRVDIEDLLDVVFRDFCIGK